ncbi:proliferating cell nuclear antigen (pcna) [Candidatus Woesearchaeota archaeon]|nr:proliferating cell nuclear antigen (pcna) [Candidatus Woesearchaeota archaeon]
MKLTLAEPRYLKESVSVISDLVTEGRFKITQDAIELVAMDPANVAMVIFKLLSSSFTEYNVPQQVDLAINMANLKQILRRAKPNDMLTLSVADNRLKVELKGTSIRTFSLPLIEVDEKEQRIPELKFPVSIQTSSMILNEAVEDADIVGDSVTFLVEGKKFSIISEGDLSHANIEIREDEDTKITLTGAEKVKAKYSLEYLKKMVGGSKLSDNVTIQFNKDYPLKIDYRAVDRVMLSFILAPRVEND